MFSPEQRRSVLRHWGTTLEERPVSGISNAGRAPIGSIQTVPIGMGLSGGEVFRVERCGSDSGAARQPCSSSWALKVWPPEATSEHVERVAALVRVAAMHCGLLAPPLLRADADTPILRKHERYWELARWIPGAPLPANAAAEAIAQGGDAIARVHAAMNPDSLQISNVCVGLSTSSTPASARVGRPLVPRCIVARISRLQSITPLLNRIAGQTRHQDELAVSLAAQFTADRVQLTAEQQGRAAFASECNSLAKTLIQAATWLVRQWSVAAPKLVARLRQHARECAELPSQWVLRDVHREHILFTQNALAGGHVVQGILDYDALEFDSPAVDLARWAGGFNTPPLPGNAFTSEVSRLAEESASSPLHAAVAGYRRLRPFSQCEWELAETLMEVNRVGGIANWLVWLVLENRRFSVSAQQIQGRISHLIATDCRTW